MKKTYLPLLLILLMVFFESCLTTVDREKPSDVEYMDVSFQGQVLPIFENNCVRCHGSYGGLNVTSYDSLMLSIGNKWQDNIIVAGDAESSGLYDVLTETPQFGIPRMPLDGPYLSADDRKIIQVWLDEGALNN
ncbi:MAG TPA: hypothetical protein DEQ34_11305 [Balneolaceae bacterium]|nr:hypothetical protein [Balneolaceae bacterium]|tara:strand:+ start:191127 stop:191528 length:402 start_codon:yes stop_codon:yes gene_type:complete